MPVSWAIITKKNPPGKRAIGGNGVAICFPGRADHVKESIINDKRISFYKTTGWRELIKLYFDYKIDKKKIGIKKAKKFQETVMEKEHHRKDPSRADFRPAKNRLKHNTKSKDSTKKKR